MIAKLLGREEANAVLTIALTGTIAVLVAGGGGPLSPGRILSGVLSNPVLHKEPAGAPRPVLTGFEIAA